MRDYDKMGWAIIFTLNDGVKFTKVVNLTCAGMLRVSVCSQSLYHTQPFMSVLGCRRNYRYNYYVHSDSKIRTHYPGPELPKYIQLDEHHYADRGFDFD